MKKLSFGIILSKPVEIGRKIEEKFLSRISFLPDRERKFGKKQQKNSKKIIKHHSSNISIQTRLRLAEKGKKNFIPNSIPTRPVHENSQKIAKKLKNIILALFQSKLGGDRSRKMEKKFRVKFRSNPTRSRKFQKNKAKKFKKLKDIILTLFLSKPGLDRPRKRKKKICLDLRS